MKLKWKFTLLFTLILSVIFSATALLSSYGIFRTNRALTDDLSTQLIESKANEAGGWLNQRIRELHTISRTPTVMSMEEDALKDYVTQLSSDMDDYYGNAYGTFGINDFSGLEYITENQTIDVRDRDYFREMLVTDKAYIFSDPVNSKTDDSLITVLCYSIYSEAGEKIGFVAASISLNKLTAITDSLSFYGGNSVIMDREGNLYTHGEKYFSEDMLERMKQSLPKDHNRQIAIEEVSDSHTAFYAPIPGSHDWFLGIVVDNERLYEDANLLTSSLAGLWIAMLIMGILAAFYISQRITRRVTILSGAMEEVQRGHLHQHLVLEGGDEISQLAKNFNIMLEDIEKLMKEVVTTQKEKRKRELQVLQAQINPHFLYNTLDTIQWKAIEYEADELSELIQELSSFFRISLSKGEEKIPLEKEIEHVRSYLAVQHYRYSEILDYDIFLEEGLKDVILPKILIQPLVENAIYHGIKPKLGKGKITIEIRRNKQRICIHVQDDGVGMSEGEVKALHEKLSRKNPKECYGLYNVTERLRLYYGDLSEFRIRSAVSEGTTIQIQLPIEREGEMNHDEETADL